MINNKTSGNLPSIASSSSSPPSTIVAPLSKLIFIRIIETEEALPEECLPNLISLRTLYLLKCPLPQGMRYLTALQNLRVWKSEVVDLSNDCDEMEWQGLTTLLSLKFSRLPKLVSLPMGLHYVSSLQYLQISECPKFRNFRAFYSKSPILLLRCSLSTSVFLGDLISDEEEPNEEAKKPARQNWDLIKAFGCCNCSTTHSLVLSPFFSFPFPFI